MTSEALYVCVYLAGTQFYLTGEEPELKEMEAEQPECTLLWFTLARENQVARHKRRRLHGPLSDELVSREALMPQPAVRPTDLRTMIVPASRQNDEISVRVLVQAVECVGRDRVGVAWLRVLLDD